MKKTERRDFVKKQELGHTGMMTSVIGYGSIVSAMADINDYEFQGDKQAQSDLQVDWAVSKGINYFDVSPTYGDSQMRLGKSLLPYRKDIYISAKTIERQYDNAKRELEESLETLHTDYLDNYQMHALISLDDVEHAFADDGVMKLMDEMKSQKVIRHVGFTAHCEKAALKALELYPFDTVLFPTNWQMHMAIGYGGRLFEEIQKREIGFLGMKSMIDRAFIPGKDTEARKKYQKSWCKPFDTESQVDLLLAAMKYAWSLGPQMLIPAGNYDSFSFAVNHADEITDSPLTEEEKQLLKEHLEEVKDYLFMPEEVR